MLKNSYNYLWYNLSNIFERHGMMFIGLYFPVSRVSLVLNIRGISDNFITVGNFVLRIVLFTKFMVGRESSSAAVFISDGGILSYPVDLVPSSDFNNLKIWSSLTSLKSKEFCGQFFAFMRLTLSWLSCCENMSSRQSSYSKGFSLHI